MSLKDRITEDMKNALRARDTPRLSAIRLLLAAIKQREVDERKEVSDADVLGIIEKMVKQRRDSIVQFEAGGREDLAQGERFEVSVLQGYLPAVLPDDEVGAAVDAAIAETSARSVQDMGKVMTVLKTRLAGRADMGKVSALVRSKLAR